MDQFGCVRVVNTTYYLKAISVSDIFIIIQWEQPLSLANKLNASLNLLKISKNSSSLGPRARIARSPSPACAAPLPDLNQIFEMR